MKKQISIIIVITLMMQLLFSIVFPIASIAAGEETVTITCKDVNFYNGLKEQLGEKIQSSVDSTMTITMTKENVESVKSITIANQGKNTKVEDITGIENFTQLTNLYLSHNNIRDISVLASLTRLIHLNLSYNNIRDISVLKSLTNLTTLHLNKNNINDISVLENLTGLTSLSLGNNNISDINVLENLIRLTDLNLCNYRNTEYNHNNISNISILENLTNLTNLNLLNNNISEISILASLTSLTNLDLSYNNISDISILESLTNLTHLGLSGNNISNISILENLTNLTNLDLNGINISDISTLASLTSLNYLYLDNNNISEISALKSLTNLKTLYLNYNNISDVSALAGLTSLNCLELVYNNISEISALKSLTNLTGLYLSNNNISDISALKSLTNLTGLYLSNNNINDIGAIENIEKIKYLDVKKQVLIGTDKDGVVQLPEIFKQAKIEGSKCYTAEDFELVNCTLNENMNAVTMINKTINASVKIKGGNADGTKLSVGDILAPKLTISYSTTAMTNKDVVATITAEEEIQEVSGWKLSTDKKSLTKTYSKNVEKETVTIKDLAGNSTSVDISIKNIDKVAPKPSVSYNSTNTSATVTIKVDEKIQQVEGWRISDDLTTLTKTYTKNTQEKITIKDLAGNTATVSVKISNITENNGGSQNQTQKKDNSTSGSVLPYTGINYVAGIAIIATIIAIIYFKKLRNLKDIK